jgi:argininosuccinate lyase
VSTLWHGRFAGGPADELLAFTVSVDVDRALAGDDLAGSRAHVRGLARAGILTDEEAGVVLAALDRVEDELKSGQFVFEPTDEDIHTAIERRVTALAGPAGAKLHTGRSRNDQVATDLRLWAKRELAGVARRVLALQRVLLERAREAGPAYLPGYTHLQRAQPVLLAHHLLAHGWALSRDVDRLTDCRRRLDVSPLGAGALAGSSLPLDPDFTAAELGFAGRFENSLDAVSDRDFVAEALFALSMIAVHLSRLGEEVILWTTDEFGFARLDDAYATGSSMLPQKKNPDIAELARGKAGRVLGATLTFNLDHMQAAADSPYAAATDLAEMLVERGVPFRDAHALVGSLVRDSLERHVPLAELVESHPDLGTEALALLEPGTPVARRTTAGGAGPDAVADQITRFAQRLDADAGRIG